MFVSNKYKVYQNSLKNPKSTEIGLFRGEPTMGFEPTTYALRMIIPYNYNIHYFNIL